MTKLLIQIFAGNASAPGFRTRMGLLSSVTGILCNALLCLGKFLIGTLSGSVSIMADSINNLSDAASSLVTLVGFKVSDKPADEGHPFGHARAEYIGGLVVSFLILLLGVEFFRTSVQKIMRPELPDFSLPALLVLSVSILVKLWMGGFNRVIGRSIDSTALLAAAQDSINDVVTTSAVLVGALLSKFTGWMLDGWFGVGVAVFILFSGFGIARETVGPLLGESPPDELVQDLLRRIRSYPGVLGTHDLMIHSYGPKSYFASIHVEVDAHDDILKSHDMIDNIERDIHADTGIQLVIHMDPIVTDDPQVNERKEFVRKCVESLHADLTMHDFRMVDGKTHCNLIFDVVLPPGCKMSPSQVYQKLVSLISEQDPTYYAVITVDRSYVSSVYRKPDVN